MILVVALIFIGPQKLPGLARSLGKGMRDVRRAMAGFEDEVRAATTLPPDEPEQPRSGRTSVSAGSSEPTPSAQTANAEPAAPDPPREAPPASESAVSDADTSHSDVGDTNEARAEAVPLDPPPPGQMTSSEPPVHTPDEPVGSAPSPETNSPETISAETNSAETISAETNSAETISAETISQETVSAEIATDEEPKTA